MLYPRIRIDLIPIHVSVSVQFRLVLLHCSGNLAKNSTVTEADHIAHGFPPDLLEDHGLDALPDLPGLLFPDAPSPFPRRAAKVELHQARDPGDVRRDPLPGEHDRLLLRLHQGLVALPLKLLAVLHFHLHCASLAAAAGVEGGEGWGAVVGWRRAPAP
uniref:Uncharacterized protein n=1 Tax=Arundo donax TaxID=35708 RepID=A0A0A9H9V5_ARUDO